MVIPSGGFVIRVKDHEGVLLAQWLTDHDYTAFMLRYPLRRIPALSPIVTARSRTVVPTSQTATTRTPDIALKDLKWSRPFGMYYSSNTNIIICTIDL